MAGFAYESDAQGTVINWTGKARSHVFICGWESQGTFRIHESIPRGAPHTNFNPALPATPSVAAIAFDPADDLMVVCLRKDLDGLTEVRRYDIATGRSRGEPFRLFPDQLKGKARLVAVQTMPSIDGIVTQWILWPSSRTSSQRIPALLMLTDGHDRLVWRREIPEYLDTDARLTAERPRIAVIVANADSFSFQSEGEGRRLEFDVHAGSDGRVEVVERLTGK